MTIHSGDYVRPNNPSAGLPKDSVWYVACSAGALKLEARNGIAQHVPRDATQGFRFPARDFDKVVLCRGQWVAVSEAAPASCCDGVLTGRMSSSFPSPPNLPKSLLTNAAAIDSLLEAALKLEAERQHELREAKAEVQAAKIAKAKADKEAAAKAQAEEAKRQLAARLHADRCLGEATLDLIAEVSRLNNGGAEQIAAASIAAHVGHLQALAKSYGYRIAQPSMIALVVRL